MNMNTKLRRFYILVMTQTFSILGSRMSALAIGIWVTKQTGNATPLALVAFFEVVPMVILSNIAGMFIDRWDRRKVMAWAGVGQAFGSLLLLVSFLSGHFEVWHLYVVALIQAIFGVFHQLAFGASVTMMVPDKQRDRANAIMQMTGPLASALAPALTAGLYALVQVTGVILFDLFSFLVAVVVAGTSIPRPSQSAEGKALSKSMWSGLSAGFRFLLSRRTLFFLIMYASLLNFSFSAVFVLNTPYILARTGSEGTLGIVLSLSNMGAILGAVIMSIWGGTRPRIHTMMIGVIASSIAMAIYGLGQSGLIIGIALTLAAFPLPFVNAAAASILQAKVPPDLQGRVMAVVGQIAMLLTPLSYLLIGPLVDKVFEPAVKQPGWEKVAPLVGHAPGAGMGLIMFASGITITLVSIVMYALPAIRHMEANLPDYEPVATEAAPPVNERVPSGTPAIAEHEVSELATV